MSISDLPNIEATKISTSGISLDPSFQLDCLIIGDMVDAPMVRIGGDESVSAGNPSQKQPQKEEVQRLLSLGAAAHIAGDYRSLRQHLMAILDLDPENALANFNLGVLERDSGRHPEAEMRFRQAIKGDPQNPEYYLALGELMQIMRHLLFAAQAFEDGLAINPNNITVLTNLISVRQRMRMPREVAELSRRVLALDAQSIAAMATLAWGLLWLGETEEAADAAGRALQLDPQSIRTFVMQQIAWKRLGQADLAASALADIERRALALWDDCASAADMFMQFEEADTAENILRVVVDKQPDFVPALLQLGRYMIVKSDLDEGFRLMSRVVELNPEEGDAQTSVALTMIRNGDYVNGWARHHWRWQRSNCEARWELPMPEWDGATPLNGKLLVWREQGIGDMVMYAAPVVACLERGIETVIETNPRLRLLLKRSFPGTLVMCRDDQPESFWTDQNVVAHCPIGDLPHLLQLDMNNYPGRDGFLTPNPQEINRLRERYQLLFPGKKIVGISWRSGNSGSAILRSIDLPRWMPIFETENCAFISLQYGDVSKDIEQLRKEHGIEVYLDAEVDAMHDLDRFAAQIAAIDVVISVDNSTVHIAGALGKTTWALIPAGSDWRWLMPDRHDTIWYRSVSLLRCLPGEGWDPQILLAAQRLEVLSRHDLDEERQALYIRCAEQSYAAGDLNTAENFFRFILSRNASYHPSLAGLGRVALRSGHIEDAIRLLHQAVTALPGSADYRRDFAAALHAGGRHEQAYLELRSALKLHATDDEALKLGIEITRRLNKPEEAANYCARLLRLNADHRDARLHLAQLQASAGDFDVADVNFRRILNHHPDDAMAAFSLGCLALRREDLAVGWAGYARRFDAGLSAPQHDLPVPHLQQIGDQVQDLSEMRLAVRPEPGLKDQILLARWLAPLRRDTAFIATELDPRLIPLIDQSERRLSLFPTGSLLASDVADLELSAQVSLGDLGQKYGTDITQLRNGVPYLRFDRDKASAMRQDYLSALGQRPLIGLCWRGGDIAIPLKEWLPILQLEAFGFVSLQAGPAQQELHEVFDGLGRSAVRDPSIDPQTNLRGFAAQIAAVDLVISIDEVPAHLAGAMGIPVICLLPKVADWRWFRPDRIDSPWYPTMQLYRQMVDNDWSDVMENVAANLAALITQGSQGDIT